MGLTPIRPQCQNHLSAVSAYGTVNINDGGVFGGTTTINADLVVNDGGTLGPGSSPGLMSIIGDLNSGAGSSMQIEHGGLLAGTEYDQTDVSDDPETTGSAEGIATLNAGANFNIDFFSGYVAEVVYTFDVRIINAYRQRGAPGPAQEKPSSSGLS